ncbi:LuxR C-terminal-related transcriptional regulator [Streptomyces sp. NPDC060085]|uniref:LuxR C-terminal-related transcriptional regulator n=1 Tax=Streptomyces sp. NPDC060085 TaxID=3347054 RepID=UPI0036660523
MKSTGISRIDRCIESIDGVLAMRPPQQIPLYGRQVELKCILSALTGSQSSGILLTGNRGIGKTRLLAEIADRFAQSRTVIRFSAIAATGELATGVTLKASDPKGNQITSGLNSSIFIIDDAHLLSESSVEKFLRTTDSHPGGVTILAASATPQPPTVSALRMKRDLQEVRIGPLDNQSMRQLTDELTNGKLDDSSATHVVDIASGNPLLLRELIYSAINEEAAAGSREKWSNTREPLTSAAIREYCRNPLSLLSRQARQALELLSLCGPATLKELCNLIDKSLVAWLQENNFISPVARNGGDKIVTSNNWNVKFELDSPLVKHALLQDLPWFRHRLHLQLLASAVSRGDLPSADCVRVAEWLIDLKECVRVSHLLKAARVCYNKRDMRRALRFAHAAWRQYNSVDAAILCATVLISRGDYKEADLILDAARKIHPQRARCLDAAKTGALSLQGETEKAEHFAHSLNAGPNKSFCLAVAEFFMGRFDDVLTRCLELVTSPNASVRLESGLLYMASLCHAGKPVEALKLYEQLRNDMPNNTSGFFAREGALEQFHAIALHYSGFPLKALHILKRERDRSIAQNHVGVDTQWGVALGHLLLDIGRPREALTYLPTLPASATDWDLQRQKVAVYRALAASNMPIANASTALTKVPQQGATDFTVHYYIAHARSAFNQCDYSTAVNFLTEAADRYMQHGGYSDVAIAAHEMARLGFAAQSKRYWSISVQGPFLGARLSYVYGVANKDVESLQEASDWFATAGFSLYAAEALAEISRFLRKSGQERRAAAATQRCYELLSGCEEVISPPLHSIGKSETLTSREREIASMAVRGLTDREIANRLDLSVRTIGNTLYRIYTKLGIKSRRELGSRMLLKNPATGIRNRVS